VHFSSVDPSPCTVVCYQQPTRARKRFTPANGFSICERSNAARGWQTYEGVTTGTDQRPTSPAGWHSCIHAFVVIVVAVVMTGLIVDELCCLSHCPCFNAPLRAAAAAAAAEIVAAATDDVEFALRRTVPANNIRRLGEEEWLEREQLERALTSRLDGRSAHRPKKRRLHGRRVVESFEKRQSLMDARMYVVPAVDLHCLLPSVKRRARSGVKIT